MVAASQKGLKDWNNMQLCLTAGQALFELVDMSLSLQVDDQLWQLCDFQIAKNYTLGLVNTAGL